MEAIIEKIESEIKEAKRLATTHWQFGYISGLKAAIILINESNGGNDEKIS